MHMCGWKGRWQSRRRKSKGPKVSTREKERWSHTEHLHTDFHLRDAEHPEKMAEPVAMLPSQTSWEFYTDFTHWAV